MSTQKIIDRLKKSDLYAEFPCGAEHKLSDILLFDGTKPFPPEVLEVQEQYEENLRKRNVKLEKNKKLTTEKATITRARAEGRKQAEVVFNNAIKQVFKRMIIYPIDIKPVLNPVDFLVFQGMNKSEEITDLVFLSRQLKNQMINKLRGQVKTSIENSKYEWIAGFVGLLTLMDW